MLPVILFGVFCVFLFIGLFVMAPDTDQRSDGGHDPHSG